MSLKIRVIPVLLLKNGLIVRSEEFRYHQVIGDPTTQLDRYSAWSIDELVYLDISRDPTYDVGRADAQISTATKRTPIDILREISTHCFAPLAFGGGIRSIEDMRVRFANGADKITVNTLPLQAPEVVAQAAAEFGRQAIVVSVDVKSHPTLGYEVMQGGRVPTGLKPTDWAVEAERLGAGEILLNSVDRDGTARGFDLELIRSVVDAVQIPVIALGGTGRWAHMRDAVQRAGAAAVAAANIFHFTEMSYKQAKHFLLEAGVNVRPQPAPVMTQTSTQERTQP